MTSGSEPTAASSTPPVPVQVIGYAGIGTDYVVPTGVKLLLGFLAAFHLLIGIPLILWTLFAIVMNLVSGSYFNPDHLIGVAVGILAGAPSVWCGIAMLVKRRPRTWRAIHAVLAVLCGLELLVFIGGAVMVVIYKHTIGWDRLALVMGVFLILAASVPFWLHAITKLLLLRANVRRAFLLEQDEPMRLQRTGTIAMMSLYGLALLGGVVAYLVR